MTTDKLLDLARKAERVGMSTANNLYCAWLRFRTGCRVNPWRDELRSAVYWLRQWQRADRARAKEQG